MLRKHGQIHDIRLATEPEGAEKGKSSAAVPDANTTNNKPGIKSMCYKRARFIKIICHVCMELRHV